MIGELVEQMRVQLSQTVEVQNSGGDTHATRQATWKGTTRNESALKVLNPSKNNFRRKVIWNVDEVENINGGNHFLSKNYATKSLGQQNVKRDQKSQKK